MQVEVKLDSTCTEPKLIVVAPSMTEEVAELVRRLSEPFQSVLVGYRDDHLELLEPSSLVRLYAGGGKVFAVTDKGEYALRLRLYELEERLSGGPLVRISHSEIINLKKAESFDLSLAGTIRVTLSDGTAAYVSRRYVSKIKRVLGI